MKRKIFILLGCLFGIGALCSVPALIVSAPAQIVAEETTPSIEIEKSKYGNVSIVEPKETYAVGDIVELHIEPKAFYLLDKVVVNGTALVADDAGAYKFALVSGSNKITALFKIDETLLGEFAGAYESAQQGDWKSVFTTQNLLIFISFLFNSGIAVALVNVFAKYRKTKTVDRKELISAINSAVPEQMKDIVSELLKEKLIPYFTEIASKSDDVIQMCQKFIQAFLYSLEGTMDSKEKIISLLSGLNLSDQNSIDELKQWFTTEIDNINKKEAEYKKLIAEMKEANEKALKEAKVVGEPEIEAKEPEKELKEEETYDGTSI